LFEIQEIELRIEHHHVETIKNFGIEVDKQLALTKVHPVFCPDQLNGKTLSETKTQTGLAG